MKSAFPIQSLPLLYLKKGLLRPLSAMVSIHFSGGCDPGSSPGGGLQLITLYFFVFLKEPRTLAEVIS